jgi:hypothetical protein
MWHQSVYCLHLVVLLKEVLNRGIRYFAQQYFIINIVYKYHNYRNKNR